MGFICGIPNIYEFDGWTFELGSYGGPWPLRKDGELRVRAGRKFWKVWEKFSALPECEQKKCLVQESPGCIPIKDF